MPRTTAALRLLGRRILAVAAVLVVTASCGSPGDPASAGGTLRVALGQAEADLNVVDYKTHSFAVLDQIYEPLLRYGRDGELTPALATSWRTSSDGRTLTFRLRKGVRFSDGNVFDAAVAEQGMRRWLGSKESAFLGITTNVRSIATPDDHTLVVHMKRAYAPALQELTVVRPARFASPDAFDEDGEFVRPIGTGPYRVRSNSPTRIVLERNPRYWGGRPKLDRVVFTVMPSSQARLAALQAGEVDVIGGDYLAPLAPEETVDLRSRPDVRVLTRPSATNLLLTFNTTTGDAALADPKVRQAVNLALDRKGYAKALFHGLAEPATQVFPPDIPHAPPKGSRPLPRDLAKARALLRETGQTDVSLRLILDPGLLPQARALSEAVQADLDRIGVQVSVDSMDSAGYANAYRERDYDLRFFPTYGPPYDPFGLLNADFRTTVPTNLYSSKRLDRLIDTALAAPTGRARAAALADVWTEMNDQWAVAPVVELPRVWAVRTSVRGFSLGPTEYDLPLTDVGVTG